MSSKKADSAFCVLCSGNFSSICVTLSQQALVIQIGYFTVLQVVSGQSPNRQVPKAGKQLVRCSVLNSCW